jgi:ubiquinone biosynthesis protein Coq4
MTANQEIIAELRRVLKERDEARASVADAYRRGAEAMRLACQEWCRAWENDGEAIADALADLRVEDKP